MLNFNGETTGEEFQQEDIISLGRLFICLGNKKASATDNMKSSMEHISIQYSPEFNDLILFLLSAPPININQLSTHPSVVKHLLIDNANLHSYVDNLEIGASQELEAARLFRLVSKINFTTGRPESVILLLTSERI